MSNPPTTTAAPRTEPPSSKFRMPPVRVLGNYGMLFEFGLKSLEQDIQDCQRKRNELNRLLQRITNFDHVKVDLRRSAQSPANLKALKYLQSKAALVHKDYVTLADLADQSVKSLKTNQTQTQILAGLYTTVAVGKGAELYLSGAAILKGAQRFKEEFETMLKLKDNADLAANLAKTAGAAHQGRTKDAALAGTTSVFAILEKLSTDTKSLLALVVTGNEIRKGNGSSWSQFITWIGKISAAFEALLATINKLYKFLKKLTDDTRFKAIVPFITPLTKLMELIANALKAKEEFDAAGKNKEHIGRAIRHGNKLRQTENRTAVSNAWLHKFNQDIVFMGGKSVDKKKLSLTYVSKIKNRADAKKWAKTLTDELARVEKELKTARDRFEARLQEHERDLRSLPSVLERFRKAKASMAKNYRFVIKHLTKDRAPKAYKTIADEVARQVYWSNVTTARYQIYRSQIGQKSGN